MKNEIKDINFSSEDNENIIEDDEENANKREEFIDAKAEESKSVIDSSEEDEAPENNDYQIDGNFTVNDEEVEYYDNDDEEGKRGERPQTKRFQEFEEDPRIHKKKKLTRLVKKTHQEKLEEEIPNEGKQSSINFFFLFE